MICCECHDNLSSSYKLSKWLVSTNSRLFALLPIRNFACLSLMQGFAAAGLKEGRFSGDPDTGVLQTFRSGGLSLFPFGLLPLSFLQTHVYETDLASRRCDVKWCTLLSKICAFCLGVQGI